MSFGRLSVSAASIMSKLPSFTECEHPRLRLNEQGNWTNECWGGLNGRIVLSVALHPKFHDIVNHAKLAIYREAWGII